MLVHIVQLIAKIDPLKYLLRKSALSDHLFKWMMILLEFDTQYVKHKVIKGKAIIDQFADFLLEDTTPMQIEFLDASIMYINQRTWKMFFDGSHTQNGVRAGVLFISPHGYIIPKSYKLLFPCKKNIAEYEALINGIKMALK